ncbi:hypothetical protein FVG97_22025 [Salmonella enterica]|uniref:histidinol-phosphate transaminase n=1 Tax=Salmonella enterica TaxID=28901 RepID=UPI0006D4B5DE|nr:histidinol-phosphate transaminase [Salmonella enterica]EBQ5984356.1 hypothetical protein [Salmonella enterica subsp. houtenae serovar Houten]EBS3902563.1 hypothetical protein [Salmonella enterica subsp. enterica serovar Heidelberg]EBS5735002.1 hypothetical protein [Salmonella enterica subsp. enterica serovar Stanley]EBW4448021.1 hypothetical protein [Salmonella enterica subsp. enterica serovar Arechavaleta]ECA2815317.1 hypothetical protein [Salmonella enterica subsp. enterica serovar Enteri
MTALNKQALIAKIKKQLESFDTVVLKEDEANALMDELEAAEKRIAELSASHSKLREGMAAIYNAICENGASTSLSAILTFVKRSREESATAAGIGVKE